MIKRTKRGRYIPEHGMSRTRIYKIWSNMTMRCRWKSHNSYKNYGARGIKIVWKSFADFYADMGSSYRTHIKRYGEKQTSIERIDNNGNYEKSNCKWVTRTEQTLNTRRTVMVTYGGEKVSLYRLAKSMGLKPDIVYDRYKYRKMSLKRSLMPTLPAHKHFIKVDGKNMSIADVARMHGIPYTTFRERFNRMVARGESPALDKLMEGKE